MDIQLKNVKIYAGMSQDSVAFNASLYLDGTKVGDVGNSGRGGANSINVKDKDGRWDRDLIERMGTEAATHTWSYGDEVHPHSLDSYLTDLVDTIQEQRDLKRKCRTQTLFRIPTETYQDGEYHVIKRKFDEAVKAHLVRSYGDTVEIANEAVVA